MSMRTRYQAKSTYPDYAEKKKQALQFNIRIQRVWVKKHKRVLCYRMTLKNRPKPPQGSMLQQAVYRIVFLLLSAKKRIDVLKNNEILLKEIGSMIVLVNL